MPPCLAAISA
jgi:hypothetical protein